jgi:hypothetical protein
LCLSPLEFQKFSLVAGLEITATQKNPRRTFTPPSQSILFILTPEKAKRSFALSLFYISKAKLN